jgi:tetratricopeptide (TPR) repeat protein/transcriptional regulator with XRE-family HTH domain
VSEIKIHPLQQARKKLGIKQKVLADLTGLSEATIKRAERGELLSPYTIAQICEYFSRRYSRQVEPQELGLAEKSVQQENICDDEAIDVENEKIAFLNHSIPLPPHSYFAHPYPLQENFTGRVQERKILMEWLAGDQYPVLALVALGGMGKSSLTWTWLQKDVLNLAGANRLHGILWWSFYETEATFASFIDQALIYTSNGDVSLTNATSIYEKTQTLLILLQQHRFLLVLDGFERELRAYSNMVAAPEEKHTQGDMQDNFRVCIDPHMGSFLRWLAASPPSSKVLLTTRLFPHELDGLVGCRREELCTLKTEDAIAFLNSQGIHGTRTETEALCKMYGNHPLTLRLLSGLIVNDPASPGDVSVASDYDPLANLIQRKHHILSLAYNSLRQPLQQLLSQLAASRSKINFEMAKVINPFETEKELKRALQELVQRGLLFFNREQRSYDFHPIVRQYAYEQLIQKENAHACLVEYFWSKAGRSLTAEVSEPIRKIRAFVIEPSPNSQHFEEHIENFTLIIELCYHMIHAKQLENAFGIYYKHLASQLYHRLGAYQVVIELLQAFISHNEESLPLLDNQKQSWLLDALAHAYSASGYPQRAVDLLRASIDIDQKLGDKKNLATALWNLAVQQQVLGKLLEAEQSLLDCIAICNEIDDSFNLAKTHQYLALQCAYQGKFQESSLHLDTAMSLFKELGLTASESSIWAYRTLCQLLEGEIVSALKSAQRTRELAELWHHERDIIRAEWVLGLAWIYSAPQEPKRISEALQEAELHVSKALQRCRQINMVDYEADLLLAYARLYHLKGEKLRAKEYVTEALAIADRSGFRVLRADISNLLARLELENGNKEEARSYAQSAYHDASCDRPPYCYKSALAEAKRLLDTLNHSLT